MARSYSTTCSAAVGSASFPELAIYMATAAGIRPKIYEFTISSSATPADYSSRFLMQRFGTAAPTGGTNPTAVPIDSGDPAALATTYLSATGGCTMTATGILMTIAVNLRASFRWVAAPGKEFVIPNTQYQGCGLLSAAQTSAYNEDLTLFWEE